jgi:hypothetical protein
MGSMVSGNQAGAKHMFGRFMQTILSLQGAGGNPLDIGLRPNKTRTLSFRWRGRDYNYKGYADLILLAISPKNTPVLVAPAANYSWDWNNEYYCTTPHYVQFSPDGSGQRWAWPPKIEPWLYGLPTNLSRNTP